MCIVCQVVWLYNVLMSGEVVCYSVVCGTLVDVSCSELLIMSEIS